MTEPLFNFVMTLDDSIRTHISADVKDKKAIAILSDLGIEVPPDVLERIDDMYAETDSHDNVMDSMRPYL